MTLNTIARTAPVVVLMDIQLPGRDDFALSQQFRNCPHRSPKVAALTRRP